MMCRRASQAQLTSGMTPCRRHFAFTSRLCSAATTATPNKADGAVAVGGTREELATLCGGSNGSLKLQQPPSRPNMRMSYIDQKPLYPGVATQVRAFEGEYTYNYSAHSARTLLDMKPLFATVMFVVPPLVSIAVCPLGTALTHLPTLGAYVLAVAGLSRLIIKGQRNTVERDLTGKVVLVTGGTGGMGQEVVAEMVRMGATVIVAAKHDVVAEAATATMALGRSGGKVKVLPNISFAAGEEGSLGSLMANAPDGPQLVFMPLDLGYFSMVRTWARKFKSITGNQLDILVHCCGVIHHKPTVNKFGDDDQLSSNLLGPYLLTEALIPCLAASGGRVVFTTTSAMSLIGKKVVHKYLQYKQGKEWNPNFEDPLFGIDRDTAPGVSVHTMESLGTDTNMEKIIAKTKLLTNVSRSFEEQDNRAITKDPLFIRGIRKQPVKVPTAAEATDKRLSQSGRIAPTRMGRGANTISEEVDSGARADSFPERFIATYINLFKRLIPERVKNMLPNKSTSTTGTAAGCSGGATAKAPQYDCLEQFGFTKLGCIFYAQDLGARSYRHSMKTARALGQAISSDVESADPALADAAFKMRRKEELDPSVNRSGSAQFTACVVNPGAVVTKHFDEIPMVAECFKFGYPLALIFMRSPFEGAQNLVNAALRPDLVNGGYYQNGRYTPSALSEVACDVKEREALMKWVRSRTYALLEAHDTKRSGDEQKSPATGPMNRPGRL